MKLTRQSGEQTPLILTSEQAAYWLNRDESSIRRDCRAAKYPGATKGVNGWVIPLIALPVTVQQRYMEAQYPVQVAAPPAISPVLADKPLLDADSLHLAYRRAPHKSKERADKLAAAVADFEDLHAAGASKGNAAAQIKNLYQVDNATLWRARLQVAAQPREMWPSLLLPRYKGRTKEAELTPDAWDWIKNEFLSTSEPAAKVVIKEAKKIGIPQGWVFPSDKTIIRRLNKIPAPQYHLGRNGNEAFDANYPAATRDFTAYALHEQWVTDGTRCDVRCIWPDGTAARPFIVAWMDMRSRLVFGVRGALNPSQRLTAASLATALKFVQIKPDTTLFDRGSEYLAKYISGGQLPKNIKREEGEMPGVLKRMGIKPEFARAYRGQAKPIEKFWDYVKEHLDKLPQFQGAYVGKNSASKPEDYHPKNAIPIDIYSAKLAEVIADYNNSHKHQGVGMNGRTPAQAYEELMQAAPHKDWARPTAEDLRLLCLEQVIRTLDNKNASIQIKIDGYGTMKYWSNDLANLPDSARGKKYIIFHNPDAPELPILIYDGLRFVCDAACISKVGNKEQAAQHYIDKAKFLKPHKSSVKDIKKAAQQTLPAPIITAQSAPLIIIEKPAALVDIPAPAPLVETSPGVFIDTATGEVFGTAKPENPVDTQAEELEKYRRIAELREAERIDKRFRAA